MVQGDAVGQPRVRHVLLVPLVVALGVAALPTGHRDRQPEGGGQAKLRWQRLRCIACGWRTRRRVVRGGAMRGQTTIAAVLLACGVAAGCGSAVEGTPGGEPGLGSSAGGGGGGGDGTCTPAAPIADRDADGWSDAVEAGRRNLARRCRGQPARARVDVVVAPFEGAPSGGAEIVAGTGAREGRRRHSSRHDGLDGGHDCSHPGAARPPAPAARRRHRRCGGRSRRLWGLPQERRRELGRRRTVLPRASHDDVSDQSRARLARRCLRGSQHPRGRPGSVVRQHARRRGRAGAGLGSSPPGDRRRRNHVPWTLRRYARRASVQRFERVPEGGGRGGRSRRSGRHGVPRECDAHSHHGERHQQPRHDHRRNDSSFGNTGHRAVGACRRARPRRRAHGVEGHRSRRPHRDCPGDRRQGDARRMGNRTPTPRQLRARQVLSRGGRRRKPRQPRSPIRSLGSARSSSRATGTTRSWQPRLPRPSQPSPVACGST